jgi:beta-lactamase regulating signal transducer with metallopeptidase domain
MSAHNWLLYFGSLTLRSAGVAAVGALATVAFRNPARRHAIWLSAMLIMLLMPVADTVLPPALLPNPLAPASPPPIHIVFMSETTAQPAVSANVPPADDVALPPVHKASSILWRDAFILYMCVAAAMLLRLGIGYRKLWLLRETSTIVSA